MERIWCVRCAHCYAEQMMFEDQLGQLGIRVEENPNGAVGGLPTLLTEHNMQPIHPDINPWMCETCLANGADPTITKWDKEIDDLI